MNAVFLCSVHPILVPLFYVYEDGTLHGMIRSASFETCAGYFGHPPGFVRKIEWKARYDTAYSA